MANPKNHIKSETDKELSRHVRAAYKKVFGKAPFSVVVNEKDGEFWAHASGSGTVTHPFKCACGTTVTLSLVNLLTKLSDMKA